MFLFISNSFSGDKCCIENFSSKSWWANSKHQAWNKRKPVASTQKKNAFILSPQGQASRTVRVLIESCNIMKVNKQLLHHSVAFGDEMQRHNLLLLWYSGIHAGSGAARDTQRLHKLPLLQTWQQTHSYVGILSVHLVYKHHLYLHPLQGQSTKDF